MKIYIFFVLFISVLPGPGFEKPEGFSNLNPLSLCDIPLSGGTSALLGPGFEKPEGFSCLEFLYLFHTFLDSGLVE